MRLLIVGPSHDLPGGQANHAAHLVADLSREPGLAVSFLPLNPRAPRALRSLQKVKYFRTLVTTLIYASRLVAQIPRHEIIHIYSASTSSFFISTTPAIVLAWLFRRKVILNYHSGKAEEQLRTWRRSSTAIMKLVQAVAVPSPFLVEVFARYGFRAQAIPNHVDLGKFRYRERSRLRPVFLWNRHFQPLYGAASVIQAFALIQKKFPEARLTLAGIGPQRQEMEALVRALDLQNVEFAGSVPPEKMPDFCDSADILLNASNVDNMPLSILEAFAAGLPVVTSDAGGIPLLVSDRQTGLLVPSQDHQALAEAAMQLLANPDLALGIARRARLECNRYSWENVRGEWVRLYTELMQAP